MYSRDDQCTAGRLTHEGQSPASFNVGINAPLITADRKRRKLQCVSRRYNIAVRY